MYARWLIDVSLPTDLASSVEPAVRSTWKCMAFSFLPSVLATPWNSVSGVSMSCSPEATSLRTWEPLVPKWPSSWDLFLPDSPVCAETTRMPVSSPSIERPTVKTMPA